MITGMLRHLSILLLLGEQLYSVIIRLASGRAIRTKCYFFLPRCLMKILHNGDIEEMTTAPFVMLPLREIRLRCDKNVGRTSTELSCSLFRERFIEGYNFCAFWANHPEWEALFISLLNEQLERRSSFFVGHWQFKRDEIRRRCCCRHFSVFANNKTLHLLEVSGLSDLQESMQRE